MANRETLRTLLTEYTRRRSKSLYLSGEYMAYSYIISLIDDQLRMPDVPPRESSYIESELRLKIQSTEGLARDPSQGSFRARHKEELEYFKEFKARIQ